MFKPQYKQQINMDGIKLKPSDVRKPTASLFVFSAIAFHFPQLLKHDTDTAYSISL